MVGSRQLAARCAGKKKEADNEFYRELTLAGYVFHRVSVDDHKAIVLTLLDHLDSGIKPDVMAIVTARGRETGKPPEWAASVFPRQHGRKMRKLFPTLMARPSILDLKEGALLDQTRKAQMEKATLTGFANTVHSGAQLVREVRKLKREMLAMQKRMAVAEERLDAAETRLDASGPWQAMAVELRALGQTYGQIADATGKPRSTVSMYLARLGKGQAG